ncbi:DUF58 domain-containing protein [Mucilaginibacter sp.]|uniref:DUF58 domain-containing protein n=1 Tax=Mucilaginibacter sp. TaxID=1882438 RepID=UPI003B00301F
MSRLLDPKIVMSIKSLQLAAKMVVDGFMNGINKSTIKGPGMEFSQYRSYQPGDDLRSLDWKMFARSDRYYIRESEVETNISVRFLVDASASMNHEDNGYKKSTYAAYLTASLAYLANLQADATGLYVLQNGGLFSLVPRQNTQHLNRLFYQLENLNPAGKFTEPVNYKELFAGNGKRELLVFVTDFYEENGEIMALLDKLSTLKHEIIVFHLIGKNELELDFAGYTTLEDLETGQTIQINAVQAQKTYKQTLNERLTYIKTQLLNRNIFYRLISMDQPLDLALRDFLNQRTKGF